MYRWIGLLWGLAAAIAAPADLVANGRFDDDLEGWSLNADGTATNRFVNVELGPVKRALELTLRPTKPEAWSITLGQGIGSPIAKGDRLRLSFRGRSADGCRVGFYVQEAGAPYAKCVAGDARLTAEWQLFEAEGTADRDYAADGAGVTLHLAHAPGTLQLADLRLLDLSQEQIDSGASVDKPVALVGNGGFTDGTNGWMGFGGDNFAATTVDSQRADLGRAARLTVSPKAGGNAWDIQFGQALKAPVSRGDMLYARIWLRSADSLRASLIIEQNTPPHTKSLQQTVTLSPEWREYRFAARALATYPPGQASFKLFLGYGRGSVEVASARVENYGPARGHRFDQTIDYWGGRPHDDGWRTAALARIEQIRRGDLTLRVVDAAGRPVPGAKIDLVQQRHAFRFGSSVPAGRLIDTASPDNVRFAQEVARLYNVVTFENDLKWHDTSPAELERIDRAMTWCAERGIDVRAHNLVWGSYRFMPGWTKDLDTAALRAAVEKRVTDQATRYAGRTYLWDVVNEAVSEHDVWDKLGREEFAKVFSLAHQADPKARLCYNEYNLLNDNAGHYRGSFERARYLLDHGAPITTFGEQAHQRLPLVPLPRVLELLDEAGQLGLDIEITEFDLGGIEDDEAHGQYVRDFLTACFSHPKVSAFIMWGFWEGAHWRAKEHAAMFRRDWSKRPAQEAWEDLVLKQWWSRYSGQTGADGRAATRVYYGRHKVTVAAGGKQIETTVERLPGGPGEVVVKLP